MGILLEGAVYLPATIEVDASMQVVPMGASENPDSPFFTSQLDALLGADDGDPDGRVVDITDNADC
jgi:hypothetical protein